LTIEAHLGYPIGKLTYAEAMQLMAESGRARWAHTAALNMMQVSINSTKRQKLDERDFNPWLRPPANVQAVTGWDALRAIATNYKGKKRNGNKEKSKSNSVSPGSENEQV